jgi:hypothetical protein
MYIQAWLRAGCLLCCNGMQLLHQMLDVLLVVLQLSLHGLQALLPYLAVLSCRCLHTKQHASDSTSSFFVYVGLLWHVTA